MFVVLLELINYVIKSVLHVARFLDVFLVILSQSRKLERFMSLFGNKVFLNTYMM